MKNISIVLLFLCTGLVACKKKNPEVTLSPLSGITQTYLGKQIPLFEFRQPDLKLASFTNLLSNVVGTALKKTNYQLSYQGAQLMQAIVDSDVNIKYTYNAKNQLITANSIRGNVTYTYGFQDRLTEIKGPNYVTTFTYASNGQLTNALVTYSTGFTNIAIDSFGKSDVLKSLPLVYLEDRTTLWSLSSLSDQNIISLTYQIYDTKLGPIITYKEDYTYTFDEHARISSISEVDLNNIPLIRYEFLY